MSKTVFYQEPMPTGGYLHIFDKFGKINRVTLSGKNTIGRQIAGSDVTVMLKSAITSRMHSEISFNQGDFYYRDLNSANGSYINGVLYGRRGNQEAKKLVNGDVITIKAVINGEYSKDAIVMIYSMSYDEDIEWVNQNLSDEIAEITVGRSSNENVSFSHQSMSKKHAVFFKARNGWAIADTNSTNGVFLNNSKIEKPTYLQPYDVVRILNYNFIYLGSKLVYQVNNTPVSTQEPPKIVHPPKEEVIEPKRSVVDEKPKQEERRQPHSGSKNPPKLVINIVERVVVQKMKKKALLKNINMEIQQGHMVLILGGSGAGKSTFLNAVMGYEKASGQIMHGDIDIYKEYELMKYDIGYVPQQDLLRVGDTTYDTLKNAAQMKLPSKMKKDERERRIEEVLELLGLQRERNSLVSKLSGGQRKRLSIAVEFIGDPSLFFLDEPDSGLDGIMAQQLMKNLRQIADKQKIVMVITHGPDRVADLFDRVIVLAKSTEDDSGHLAFYGSVSEAYSFFETKSLEGVVQKINRKDEGGEGLSDYFIKKYKNKRG